MLIKFDVHAEWNIVQLLQNNYFEQYVATLKNAYKIKLKQ